MCLERMEKIKKRLSHGHVDDIKMQVFWDLSRVDLQTATNVSKESNTFETSVTV